MDIIVLAAAFAGLVAGALYYLFHWQPTKKTWCVILYHLSRDSNAQFQWPDADGAPAGNALDDKLDQVVSEIESVPCASALTFVKTLMLGQASSPEGVNWEDVHVVYRALWNPPPIRSQDKRFAQARVVTWRPGAPSVVNTSFAAGALDDRDGFFNWAYQNCPADHYAVFFWGHSLGPGGLFELNNSVQFPALPSMAGWTAPASLIDVEGTLQILYDLRDHGKPTIPMTRLGEPPIAGTQNPGSDGGGPGSSGASSGAAAGVTRPKAEVVLFQDCWMSTLETAFQLQDVARYVIASQSLVPIGYQYASGQYQGPAGPVWPYTKLIARLLEGPNQFIDPLLGELKGFFDQVEADRLPFPVVPFSVLDLGETNEIATVVTPPMQSLVRALGRLGNKAERFVLLKDNTLVRPRLPIVTLEAGEYALVDVLKLCAFLQVPANYFVGIGPAIRQDILDAATAVAAVVAPQPVGSSTYSLVRSAFESPTLDQATHLGFKGASVLWIPARRTQTPSADRYLADQIDGAFYSQLRFVTETAHSGKTWKDYAFEQTN